MPHAIGTDLGGIRTLEGLRARCYVDTCSGCWHLRTANGRLMPRGKRHAIWLSGHGSKSATRAALMLAGGPYDPEYVVYRTCTSYDCVNPEHLGQRSREAHGLATALRRDVDSWNRANRSSGAKRSRVSAQARARIAYSGLPLRTLAQEFGISVSYASAIRAAQLRKTIAEVAA